MPDNRSAQHFPSTDDRRATENVMRHAYRKLSDEEKAAMERVKDLGEAFFLLCGELGASRELSLAKTKIEEAVFWACKHITR